MEKRKLPDLRVMSYPKASKELTLREKAGQFFMPAAFINDSEEDIKALEKLIREQAIGGVCFFHSRASAATNFEGKKKVIYNAKSLEVLKNLISRYQKVAKFPLMIAIDAEWGLAMRIEQTPRYPYAMTLGATNEPLLVYEVAKNIGLDCRSAGIHWNFAPVADINNNPENPVIGYRSFGSLKEGVSVNAVSFSRGLQDSGILSCAKHFPGHGDTATDSHLALPVLDKTEAELFEEELQPFQALIKNDVDGVMVGHISIPSLTGGRPISASVSKDIINGLLRNKLGYKGVVVSDALNMHGVSKAFPEKGSLEWTAFDAGTDVLCFSEYVVEGVDKILKLASENRIEESFKRVWELKEKAINTLADVPSRLSEPLRINKTVARKSLTLYKGDWEVIQNFRQEGYYSLTLGNNTGSRFQGCLGLDKTEFLVAGEDATFSQLQKEIGNQTRVLLSLFLPTAKPHDFFGLGKDRMEIIRQVIRNYDVIVYLFGNPYFLNHVPREELLAIMIAYQDLEGFEEIAADHFLGNFTATGILPVTL